MQTLQYPSKTDQLCCRTLEGVFLTLQSFVVILLYFSGKIFPKFFDDHHQPLSMNSLVLIIIQNYPHIIMDINISYIHKLIIES